MKKCHYQFGYLQYQPLSDLRENSQHKVILGNIQATTTSLTSLQDSINILMLSKILAYIIPIMLYPPAQISDEQKANLHEVADLMLKIYETLVEMRYLDPKGIVHGPHNITSLDGTDLQLDPTIVYLYSILPYVDEEGAGARDFFHGGTFADFRVADHVEQGRDPFYASPEGDFDAENGQYIRPWATPLSLLGNHGTVLIYDGKQHRIWAVDQEGWSTTDPALCSEQLLKGTSHEVVHEKSDWGDDSSEDYMSDGSEGDLSHISGNSSEFWSDESDVARSEIDHLCEDQQDDQADFDEGFDILDRGEQQEAEEATRSKNTNSFDHIPSRPAGDVLRSINQWYRELKEVPGQGEYSGLEWMEPEILRPLYLRNGWPDAFDADAFEVDKARTYGAQRAKYNAEDPLRQVECYEGWLKYDEVERRTQEVKDAKNDDQRWTARFKLWQAEQTKDWNNKELAIRKQKAALRCPGGICQREEDLPLWELEYLRSELHVARERLDRFEKDFDPESPRQRHDRKKARIHVEAYEASAADARRLCPGRTFEQATGMKSLGRTNIKTRIEQSRESVDLVKAELEELKDWAEQLPSDGDVPLTKRLVSDRIVEQEDALKRAQKNLEREEKWFAEHGDVD